MKCFFDIYGTGLEFMRRLVQLLRRTVCAFKPLNYFDKHFSLLLSIKVRNSDSKLIYGAQTGFYALTCPASAPAYIYVSTIGLFRPLQMDFPKISQHSI